MPRQRRGGGPSGAAAQGPGAAPDRAAARTGTTAAPETSGGDGPPAQAAAAAERSSNRPLLLLLATCVCAQLCAAYVLGLFRQDASTGTPRGGAGRTGVGFRCGPADAAHFSELPARGMHILTAAGGDAHGACAIDLHVDGMEAHAADGARRLAGLEGPCAAVAHGAMLARLREAVPPRRQAQLTRLRRENALSRSAYGGLHGIIPKPNTGEGVRGSW